jgi:hypothetical protein
MNLVFLDEAGYSHNWKKDIEGQPFMVLAAVMVDADRYIEQCEVIRDESGKIGVELKFPLGLGFEIKASSIAKGEGWWGKNTKERNCIRELMLNFPANCGGKIFLTIIDKKRHIDKYATPEQPHELCFKYIFERIQWELNESNENGICIYDQTKFMDDDLHDRSMLLMRNGSSLSYFSNYYGYVSGALVIDRIKEFHLGTSKNSLGLQVADYYATFAYQYYRKNKPENCDWWTTIRNNLRSVNGEYLGYGLKVFPD